MVTTKKRASKKTPEGAGGVVAKMETRLVPVTQLERAGYNPRKITPHALEALRASLAEFGYVQPIVWNETSGVVVGGHQRLDALVASGATSVEVVVVRLDALREKALNVTLNNPANQGTWDDEKLQAIVGELRDAVDDGAFADDYFERVGLDELAATFDDVALDHRLGEEGEPVRVQAPSEFPAVDDATIKTDYRCPKCAYEWAGKPK